MLRIDFLKQRLELREHLYYVINENNTICGKTLKQRERGEKRDCEGRQALLVVNVHEIVCLRRNSICQQDTKERFSPQNTWSGRFIVSLFFFLTQVVPVAGLNEGSST